MELEENEHVSDYNITRVMKRSEGKKNITVCRDREDLNIINNKLWSSSGSVESICYSLQLSNSRNSNMLENYMNIGNKNNPYDLKKHVEE